MEITVDIRLLDSCKETTRVNGDAYKACPSKVAEKRAIYVSLLMIKKSQKDLGYGKTPMKTRKTQIYGGLCLRTQRTQQLNLWNENYAIGEFMGKAPPKTKLPEFDQACEVSGPPSLNVNFAIG